MADELIMQVATTRPPSVWIRLELSSRVFCEQIHIEEYFTVSDLTKAIKREFQNNLAHVDASEIYLFPTEGSVDYPRDTLLSTILLAPNSPGKSAARPLIVKVGMFLSCLSLNMIIVRATETNESLNEKVIRLFKSNWVVIIAFLLSIAALVVSCSQGPTAAASGITHFASSLVLLYKNINDAKKTNTRH